MWSTNGPSHLCTVLTSAHQPMHSQLTSQLTADARVKPSGSRRPTHLSPAQIGTYRILNEINSYCFKQISYGVVCYSVRGNRYGIFTVSSGSRTVLSFITATNSALLAMAFLAVKRCLSTATPMYTIAP